ncbi:MAG: TetR/AcrR family transcriptional regulator [Syntrophaceae bacterium]|nr:TetR/AcrR family transcriptional regulator [Syntrophaceae bacterium]
MRRSPAKPEGKEIGTQIKDLDLVRKKRLQIALGASKLFIKKGYPRSTMREISRATGLTIGNLYDYIKTKEDVLCLVFDVFHSTWSHQFEEEGIFAIEDPLEQLRMAVRKKLELANRVRDMILLMYTESKLLPRDTLRSILEKESRLIGDFERILKNGIEKKVFKIKDPFFAANVITYLLSIEPLRGWNLRRKYSIPEIDGRLEEFILKMVLAPEQPERVKQGPYEKGCSRG